MLVLSRRIGEKIQIGDDVVVSVVKIQGGQVRLGVEAPREVPVIRGELHRNTPPNSDTQPRPAP
jgi:carbon storage regulator